MSNIQDRFHGETQFVTDYDADTFFISKPDQGESVDDTFKYADSMLRPSHIIALHSLIEEFENVLIAQAPVVLVDGKPRTVKTSRGDSFKQLYEFVEKYLEETPVPVLYTVWRQKVIDSTSFEPRTLYALRYCE